MVVRCRVLVRRRVTAADVAARHADAQVDPGAAHCKAILTTCGAGLNDRQTGYVFTGLVDNRHVDATGFFASHELLLCFWRIERRARQESGPPSMIPLSAQAHKYRTPDRLDVRTAADRMPTGH
jgi:hypothetical protein